MRTIAVVALGALLVVLSVSACDDPTRIRTPPPLPMELDIMAVLDPDRTIQHVQVEPVDTAFALTNVMGRLYENGELVETDFLASPDDESAVRRTRCAYTFGSALHLPWGVCLEFDYWPDYDSEYRVEVSAEGYATASGVTQVPGLFEIRQHSATGSPPGVAGLDLGWTDSERAHKYVVSVMPETTACCGAWHTETDVPGLSATAPAAAFSGSGPWKIRVRAVSRALYEYLTTGADGSLFAVPPIQNVEGGYGVVGGWTSRDIVRDTVRPVVRRGDWQVAGRPLPELLTGPRLVTGSRSGTVYVVHGDNDDADVVRWDPRTSTWSTAFSGFLMPYALASLDHGVILATLTRSPGQVRSFYTSILISDHGGEIRELARLPTRSNPYAALVDEAERLQIYSAPVDADRPFVLRSTDWGQTFDEIEVEATVNQGPFAFNDIEESPVDGTLFATCFLCEIPVYRSADRGLTWEPRGASLVGEEPFWQLEVGADGRVYIGGIGGVWVSGDRGESWTRSSTEPVRELRVNPRDPDQVWFSSHVRDDGSYVYTDGVFQSTDGGRTFESVALQNSSPRGLIVDPEARKLYTVDWKKLLLALDIP